MQGKRVPMLSAAALAMFAVVLLVTSASASVQEKLLHRFAPQGSDGAFPSAGVAADSAGNRYGTAAAGGTSDGGIVFELSPRAGGGWTEKVLYNFKTFGGDGFLPYAGLVLDAHGSLYGTTYQGGANCAPNGCGAVFELSPNGQGGWTETVLHSFNANGTDGAFPYAGLIFDNAGNLYGTTAGGGSSGGGVVFEMSPRQGGGWTETVLYSFCSQSGCTDGGSIDSGVIFDAHGNLYGMAAGGGANGYGAVFELSPRHGGGWTETVLYSFCKQTNCPDGSYPSLGGLIFDAHGNLYGTTGSGGAYNNAGTVFELSPNGSGGWTETVLHSFGQATDGSSPGYCTLLLGPDDYVYGTTRFGGLYNLGTVFELYPRRGGVGWTETVIHSFDNNGTDGAEPGGNLILDEYGNLFGAAGGGTAADGVVFELSPRGGGRWKEAILYNFNFDGTDGANPWLASLVFDAQGNLYGTTANGGVYENGAAFELKPNGNGSWTEEVIYSFGNGTGTNAGDPGAGLIFDGHGNLYGTSYTGGIYGQWGAVYELSPSGSGGWTEQVLHSFNNNGIDGYQPFGGVVFDGAGNLYGTTQVGGSYGYGAVFELSPNGSGGWTETLLHSFNFDGTDGAEPWAGLFIDNAGNLYGTTVYGGSTYVGGTVFELSPNGSGGWTETVLHSFSSNGTDGVQPYASLIPDAAHNLYGTTLSGGANGAGAIFQLTPQQNGTWTEKVLYSFCAQTHCADGSQPYGSLTFFGSNSDLYGTTSGGGANGGGTVFELTPTQGGNWNETVLHSFNPSSGDGFSAQAGVVFDASGDLYGVTYNGGGTYDAGTVFEVEGAADLDRGSRISERVR